MDRVLVIPTLIDPTQSRYYRDNRGRTETFLDQIYDTLGRGVDSTEHTYQLYRRRTDIVLRQFVDDTHLQDWWERVGLRRTDEPAGPSDNGVTPAPAALVLTQRGDC